MQLINQLCDDMPENYTLMCLVGVLPRIMRLAYRTNYEIKVEVAYFMLKAFVTSPQAISMIYAFEGFKILR